jgi:hypothetical protein
VAVANHTGNQVVERHIDENQFAEQHIVENQVLEFDEKGKAKRQFKRLPQKM